MNLEEINQWLLLNYIKVTQEWITACLENIPDWRNKPAVELQQNVLKNWLYQDLSSAGVGFLPANIMDQQYLVIEGKHILQVNSIRDISQSAFSQLLVCLGKTNENIEVTAEPQEFIPKPNRMLSLSMTDGKQLIQGIEFSSIPALSVNMAPGVKILISGPIDCYFGVLHLTEHKIRIIGGSVECLRDIYSQERVLGKAIGLTEASIENEIRNLRLSNGTDNCVDGIGDVPLNENRTRSTRPGEIDPERSSEVNKTDEEFADLMDDDFLESNTELLDEIERNASRINNKVPNKEETRQSNINNIDLDSSDVVVLSPQAKSPKRSQQSRFSSRRLVAPTEASTSKMASTGKSLSKKNQQKISSFFNTGSKPISPSAHLNNQKHNGLFSYLYEIRSATQQKVNQTITVKGFIGTFLSKLKATPDTGFQLKVLVNDGTMVLECGISETVLTKLIGFDSKEFHHKIKLIKDNPKMKHELHAAMMKCTDTLRDISCLITIEFSTELECPRIIEFKEISNQLANVYLK